LISTRILAGFTCALLLVLFAIRAAWLFVVHGGTTGFQMELVGCIVVVVSSSFIVLLLNSWIWVSSFASAYAAEHRRRQMLHAVGPTERRHSVRTIKAEWQRGGCALLYLHGTTRVRDCPFWEG